MKVNFSAFVLTILLFSCKVKDHNELEEAQKLYMEGVEYVYKSKYESAKYAFNKIDSDFPYTEYAPNSSIFLAYINYRQKNYSSISPIVDIYVKTAPGDPNIPYLFYLKGIAFYDQIKNFRKDKEVLRLFMEVINLMKASFPESPYTEAIVKREEYINKMLFLGELDIALQYHKAGNCIAAAGRYLQLQGKEIAGYEEIINENLASCLYTLGLKEKADLFVEK